MKILRAAVAGLACTLVAPLKAQDTRLSNVSVRTAAGGAHTLITGFTIGPGTDKVVLVRAVGPTLGAFGVPDTLADPKLELFNAASVKIAENDNFNPLDAPTFASVGAFALNIGAKDAALVAALAPGSYSAQVTGVEGEAGLVRRAGENAQRNGITNAQFFAADLAADQRDAPWAKADHDLLLLDPPRSGAEALLEYLPKKSARRIVYVSCHPGSLARDAGTLVNRHGFTLTGAGAMDMFPHTAHVESIAVFDRK